MVTGEGQKDILRAGSATVHLLFQLAGLHSGHAVCSNTVGKTPPNTEGTLTYCFLIKLLILR